MQEQVVNGVRRHRRQLDGDETTLLGKQFRCRYTIKAARFGATLCIRKLIFSPNEARTSRISVYCHRRTIGEICNYLLHANEIATIDPPLTASTRGNAMNCACVTALSADSARRLAVRAFVAWFFVLRDVCIFLRFYLSN